MVLANEAVSAVPDATLVGGDAGHELGHAALLLSLLPFLSRSRSSFKFPLADDPLVSALGESYSSTQDQSTSEHSDDDADRSWACLKKTIKNR